MCGIIGFSGPPDPGVLRHMTTKLVHRGPDDVQTWEGSRASLGFTRLAILDLTHGQQPTMCAAGDMVSVFNGEIYNHAALREQLLAAGYPLTQGHSDAELIPYLYQAFGADFVDKIEGMFAIALYIQTENTWLLYRDHAGIKPLFYSLKNGTFIFASEIKSLLAHPGVSNTPNSEAIYHFFTFKNVPSPSTAFKDIQQLRPGEMIRYQNNTLHKNFWWRIQPTTTNLDDHEAAQQLHALLKRSVLQQAKADVEVGAFLSGGIDSSAVVALYAQQHPSPIKTFTLTYGKEHASKSRDQQNALLVSKHFNTDHHELTLTEKGFWADVEDIVSAFDEPFSGVNSTFFLSRLIAKHVKVALSGDGADELFGSYLPHRLAQPLHDYANASLLERQSWQHPEFSNQQLETLIKLPTECERRMAQLLWTDNEKTSIFTPTFAHETRHASSLALIKHFYRQSAPLTPLNKALYFDFHCLLPDQVLTFVDRLSMAHSLEVRPPFLDRHLIEFAFSLKDEQRIRGNEVKWLLKKSLETLLPKEVVYRKKEGFIPPINYWLERDSCHQVEAYLDPETIRKVGVLDYVAVRNIADRAKAGDYLSQNRLWNIMMFCAWSKRYLC